MKLKTRKRGRPKQDYGPNRAYALSITRWATDQAERMGDPLQNARFAWARLVSDTHVRTCTCVPCLKADPTRPERRGETVDLLFGLPRYAKSTKAVNHG